MGAFDFDEDAMFGNQTDSLDKAKAKVMRYIAEKAGRSADLYMAGMDSEASNEEAKVSASIAYLNKINSAFNNNHLNKQDLIDLCNKIADEATDISFVKMLEAVEKNEAAENEDQDSEDAQKYQSLLSDYQETKKSDDNSSPRIPSNEELDNMADMMNENCDSQPKPFGDIGDIFGDIKISLNTPNNTPNNSNNSGNTGDYDEDDDW